MMRKTPAAVAIAAALWLAGAMVVAALQPIATTPFLQTWGRTDALVGKGSVSRTWMWGPGASSLPLYEPYAEAPGGKRLVQYFDKSRMEDNAYNSTTPPWNVTNGLLAEELVTGKLQSGNTSFEQHDPAAINVAGDANDPDGPTYATFNPLMGYGATPSGWRITQTVNRAGQVGNDPSLASDNVTAQDVGSPTHHNVASVFWDFMNSAGPVIQYPNGSMTAAHTATDKLFPNPFYATGYPLTEAYWTHVLVGGVSKQVLVQVFERRVLTYTPSNPAGWQVEAGNVGQQYFQWRYIDLKKPLIVGGTFATAWVSDPNPAPGSSVTVYGKIFQDGQPVSGVPMTATWHFKTTTETCSAVSGADGVASCTRDIGGSTSGYAVTINVAFTLGLEQIGNFTVFIPK